MSEEQVSGSVAEESASLPEVKISGDTNDQQSSKPNSEAEQLRAELRAIAREEAEKQWQSGKDQRWDKVEREYGKLSKVSERVAAALDLLDPEDQQKYAPKVRQRVTEEVLEELLERSSSPKTRGNGNAEVATSELLDIFVEAGVGTDANAVRNSKEYLEFFNETKFQFSSEKEMAIKAAKFLTKRRASNQTQVSEAVRAQGTGGGAVNDPNGELTEYIQQYKAAIESGDGGLASRLRSEARKKGLPIDAIQWEAR